MKKLILTSFVLFASVGILFAEGHCQKKDYAYFKESKLENCIFGEKVFLFDTIEFLFIFGFGILNS